MDKKNVIETLNGILELELAGIVRYRHDSPMIFDYARTCPCPAEAEIIISRIAGVYRGRWHRKVLL